MQLNKRGSSWGIKQGSLITQHLCEGIEKSSVTEKTINLQNEEKVCGSAHKRGDRITENSVARKGLKILLAGENMRGKEGEGDSTKNLSRGHA